MIDKMMLNYIKKNTVRILILSVFLLAASTSLQAAGLGGLEKTAEGIGYKKIEQNTPTTGIIAQRAGLIINSILSFLSFIFFALIVGGAFKIVGAGGDEATVTTGKKIIKNGAVGLLIVLSAYFVTKAFMLFVGNGVFKGPA